MNNQLDKSFIKKKKTQLAAIITERFSLGLYKL